MSRTIKGKAKRKPIQIRRISQKMLEQKRAEIEVRIALAERCGGEFILTSSVTGGYCKRGTCEICRRPAGGLHFDRLYPHEKIHRSQGGKLSLENTVMCHNWCQAKEGHGIKIVLNSKPQWTKGGKL